MIPRAASACLALIVLSGTRVPCQDPDTDRARAIEQVVEGLRKLRNDPVAVKTLREHLVKLSDELRAELGKVREAVARARHELEALEERIAANEKAERELVARLEAVEITSALLGQGGTLPGREVLAALYPQKVAPPRELTADDTARSRELFTTVVGPLLEAKCHRCHGEERQKGELSLLSREAVLRGGSQGPAIVPAASEASLLYRLVTADGEPHMPPGKKRLSTAEIAAIRAWIDSGAMWATAGGASETARPRKSARRVQSF